MNGRWDPTVLRDYALVADGERGAVVGPHGEMVWLCFPHWHSPAVFASLIGATGGYQVQPSARYVSGGSYEPGTLIWKSRWITDSGVVECREALALPARPDRMVLLRRIEPACDTELQVRLALRAEFGRLGPRRLRRSDGGCWRGDVGELRFVWSGASDAAVSEARRHHDFALDLRLRAGERHDLVLTLTTGDDAHAIDPDEAWTATEAEWHARSIAGDGLIANRDVQHAHAVLRGLTGGTGAMVAAATTSLPERADEGRNYDYRYAWIRDQCFVGTAMSGGVNPDLLDHTVRFVTARVHADGPRLAPAYTVAGERVPSPSRLELPGYPGGADVVGNHVNEQFQLDVFGETLELLAAADADDRLDADGWAAAEIAASAIAERWDEPDAGIWELKPDWWTHSRLACAAGLRAAAKRPRAGHLAASWESLADSLVARASRHALHPSGRWQRSPTDDGVDAALLLAALRGAVPPDDPRCASTLRAVLDELTEDGYAYRFRHDGQPLAHVEGAFLFCGFLVSLSLLQHGDAVGAARWFERNRSACGSSGLFTEEFDVAQRQLRGNLPQAFVHGLLVECAQRLSAACDHASSVSSRPRT